MVHPICRIASFDTVGAYTRRIGFDDGHRTNARRWSLATA